VGEAQEVPVKTSDFDYELPGDLIAQRPAETRDASRLLVLRRESGAVEHRRFTDLLEYLRAGDLLVLNESRVIPARLLGRKRGTGGRAEVFLLRRLAPGRWEALVRPGARVRPDAVVEFDGGLSARVVRDLPSGVREIELAAEEDPDALVERVGTVPLPPYIERVADEADRERYQTVYATVPGAVAAPTAGLHFTTEMLARAAQAGVGTARVVLHVGLGTFRPVTAEEPGEHEVEEERYAVSAEAAAAINAARAAGGRVVAVGTTSVRVLETAAGADGRVAPGEGATRLFIREPHRFRCTDALVTNFHLPKSTLLMLVSAFAGREAVLAAYREAVGERYRFYSYGDAMLIV
jgi:S-adenosylmethionine:tRNA ribosyltransferase-isomerase